MAAFFYLTTTLVAGRETLQATSLWKHPAGESARVTLASNTFERRTGGGVQLPRHTSG
jgi:hypothetical protein